MKRNHLAYKIGLSVNGVFVVGLAIFVLMQANNTKQDAATDKKANAIADKLNAYVSDHQAIPESLSAAGISSVPSTITYQKLNAGSYKFCVTYKANSSGFDATSAVIDAASGSPDDSSSDSFDDSSDNFELFIDTTHHKGANCQTVKPTELSTTNIDQINPGEPNVAAPAALCGFGSSAYSGCSIRCIPPTVSNASRIIDGTVQSVTTSGNTANLTIIDTKNQTHYVAVPSTINVFNSDCTALGHSLVSQGDEVRVIVTAKTVYPGAQNDHITAAEVDDFSE